MKDTAYAQASSVGAARLRLLAISSGGGHWVQLLRLRPAFEHCDVTYSTVAEDYRDHVGQAKFMAIRDATRSGRLALAICAFSVLQVLWNTRPHVIVSTGAAPGCLAITFGKLFGARTIWVDSIANVEIPSLSGRLARGSTDLWLTQWPHLATGGLKYRGNVL